MENDKEKRAVIWTAIDEYAIAVAKTIIARTFNMSEQIEKAQIEEAAAINKVNNCLAFYKLEAARNADQADITKESE